MEAKHDDQIAVASGSVERGRLASLINSMADGVIALDRSMKIVVYNGAALNILDSNGQMVGQLLGSVFRPYGKDGKLIDIHAIVKDSKTATSSRDWVLHYDDNSTANIYASIAPVHLGYGQKGSEGYVVLLRDITHEKSLEEERNEFISVVSHELRTPITIAEGNLSNAMFVAEKTGDISQVKSALKAAHDQVLFLADMINDLSTLSRAEGGKLVAEAENINAHELLKDLADEYAENARSKGLELTLEPSAHLELIKSSRLYVREILQNFITNSIKYTEHGSVTIGAKPGANGVIFSVSDTGIGISKSDQERIFDKFFRSEDFRTRKRSGTGLGLYITVKLARLLHADISVESTLNKGSTFHIYVPNLQ